MGQVRSDRRQVIVFCAVLGIALGVAGFAWYTFGLDDHASRARCGTRSEQSQFSLSWTLMALGPYLGCVVVPTVWQRRPGVRIGWGFALGFAVAVITGVAFTSGYDNAPEAFILPVIVGLALWAWFRSVPGKFSGYVLGVTTVPALFILIYAWADTCS